MVAEASIVIDRLSKRYGHADRLALQNVSLVVNPGEVYGFLGPNGAGKSTAIRILMNFLQPTKGSARILGQDIVRESVAIKRSVGYLSGDFAAYPKMNGKQYLSYMSELRGDNSLKKAKALAKRLQADLTKPLGELSRGNRQKIGIIQALMHEPKVLILDEATSGLDPLMQEEFYKLVREAKQKQAAIFSSSHILSEVQKVCDRVGIIKDGQLINEQVIAEMAAEAAQTFDITFAGRAPKTILQKINGVKLQQTDGSRVTLHFHGKLSALFEVLAKHDVQAIDTRNLDLEELFKTFYKDKGGKQ